MRVPTIAVSTLVALLSASPYVLANPTRADRVMEALPVQYDRDREPRSDYNNFGAQNPNGRDTRDYRGGRIWRPGEVIPDRFLDRVVPDWEERGLSRPPGGHQWVRVNEQFLLVRGRDRMIARVLNFY